MRRWHSILPCLLLCLTAAACAEADEPGGETEADVGEQQSEPEVQAQRFDQAGPAAVTVATINDPVTGLVAFPNAGGPFPLVVLGHGFSANETNQNGWGKHFASWGFVAASVRISSGLNAPDGDETAEAVQGLLDAVAAGEIPPALVGKIDTSRVALAGHSAGAQAMAVVATKLANKPDAVVLFDPVAGGASGSSLEPGQSAVAQICSPLLTIFAEDHKPFFGQSCNKRGNWKPFAMSSTGPRARATVVGSTHCDGENAPRGLCGFACGGGANVTRQKSYSHYATAWLLAHVKGDAAASAAVRAEAFAADTAVRDASVASGSACASSL
jgi:dienelactone hydrolase